MDTPFTPADVARIALLARLELSAEETDRLAGQLLRVLEYVEQLREIDTAGVPPTFHAFEASPNLREDTPAQSLAPAEALANAPEADDSQGLFKVPRVLG